MDRLRLAIISTPRSGNCWLRKMLAQLLELEEIRAKVPDDVVWNDLPQRAVLLLHWPAEDRRFVERLAAGEFRVIVLARHPLDVLISILVYSQHDASTRRWLEGAGGDERALAGAAPTSAAFESYACGPRANALLHVSSDWWTAPDVCRVRYEELVVDTAACLERLLDALAATARVPISSVIEESAATDVRALSLYWLYHIWQASPGLWKRLLTAGPARRIAAAQRMVLDTLGYCCDPSETLTEQDAAAIWSAMETAALKRNVYGVKSAFYELDAQLRNQLEAQRQETHRLAAELAEAQKRCADHQQLREEIEQQRYELIQLQARLAEVPWDHVREVCRFGPRALAVARAAQTAAHQARRAASTINAWFVNGHASGSSRSDAKDRGVA